MSKLTLIAFAATSLLAVPAFAQTSTAAAGSAVPSAMTSTSGNASAGSSTSSSGTTSPADAMQMRQKITSDLQKDGFTNVHVVADSFLVNAENKEGQKVVMIINPDSVFSMTEAGPGQTNGTSSTTTAKK